MFKQAMPFIFLLALPVYSHSVQVESRVERVIVYPKSATVTRVADLNLSKGENTITLVGLVPGLDANDVRVEIEKSNIEIGQVKLVGRAQRQPISDHVRELLGKIDQVERKIRKLSDSSNAARLRLDFIKSVSQGFAKEAWFESTKGSADIPSWKEALTLIQSGSDDANKLIRENASTRKDLEQDLSKLRRELSSASGRSRANSEFEITLISSRSQESRLKLHYLQEDAYWEPLYEARLDSDTGKLRLAQQAVVQQQTEENWTNVALVFSTSQPSEELQAPELDPEFLTLREPHSIRSYSRSKLEKLDDLVSVSALSAEKLEASGVGIEEVIIASSPGLERASIGSFAVNYEIPGSVSVPNDSAEELTFDLARFEFDTELVTRLVPREISEAFLGARFTYNDELPMYSSEMTVFVDSVYVGKTVMPTLLPETEAILPMGQDRRIELNVKSQGKGEGSKGIVKKRKTETTDYLYEITNRRSSPTEVEVYDWYPVANHADIKIDLARNATAPTEKDLENKPGVFLWRKKLSANETWSIQPGHTVSYPANLVLVEE